MIREFLRMRWENRPVPTFSFFEFHRVHKNDKARVCLKRSDMLAHASAKSSSAGETEIQFLPSFVIHEIPYTSPYMPKSRSRTPTIHKIALTGGPGGGKSTAAELFRREYKDHISLVPEVATLLFKGGYPRVDSPLVVESIQSSIFNVQINIEDTYGNLFPHHTLLCDRGTVDGAAYWPPGRR